ncbi:MAG TPA: tripartite tricarboxylate transporter substrate binding protein [Eoetvoesiella sp.]
MRQQFSKVIDRLKPNRSLRRFLGHVAGVTALVLLGQTPVLAAGYPENVIKVVVPFPAGGSTDAVARVMAKGLADVFSQSVVVENRPGAAGIMGVASALRSPADGYTLGVSGVGPTIIGQLIGLQVPYDPVNDLVPVGNLGALPLVFAVKGDLPVNSIADLVALAKAKPGALSYGSSGTGSPGHLVFEYFKKIAGLDIVHIPYKGDAPLTTDLIGGQLEIGVITSTAALAQAQNNKLKFLAVTSGIRYPQLSAVPSLIESGYKDISVDIWNLLVAPKGTPAEVISTLNGAMNKVLALNSTKETLGAQGYLPPVLMTVDETRAFLANERAKWKAIVKTTGVSVEK